MGNCNLHTDIEKLSYEQTWHMLDTCERCLHYYSCDFAGELNSHLAELDTDTSAQASNEQEDCRRLVIGDRVLADCTGEEGTIVSIEKRFINDDKYIYLYAIKDYEHNILQGV